MSYASKGPLASYALSHGYHHMDSTLQILSGCQCPPIHNMVTERLASRMIVKVVSEGFYGSNLIHMDVGSALSGSA
eukprot:1143912-Pelagomonas_calceolata.AAC.1